MISIIFSIAVFIIILSLLVFIHELGHFLTARKFGVDVEEFGMGIPPRIWGKKVGGTLYSINALPFGGFVKIKGEDFEGYNPKDKTNFINKKPWQKSVVLLAGIFMNLVLGIAIFYVVLGSNGWRSNPIMLMDEFKFKFGETVVINNIVTFMEEDSPALKAGMEFGDQIISLSYEDEKIKPTDVAEVRNFLSGKEGQEVQVEAYNINTKQEATYYITPQYKEEVEGPALGVALGEAVYISYQEPSDKILAGILHSYNVMDYSIFALKNLVVDAFKTKDATMLSQGVGGPILIFSLVDTILGLGGPNIVFIMLDMIALLSLSLAIMNLLPIPALDGGRLVFVLVEWVTGKRPSPRLEETAHKIGYICLILFLVLITVKDLFVVF